MRSVWLRVKAAFRHYRGQARQIWIYRGSVSLGLIVGLLIFFSDQFAEVVRVNAETYMLRSEAEGWSRFWDLYWPVQAVSLLPIYLRLLASGLYAFRDDTQIPPPGPPVAILCSLPQIALILELWYLADEPELAEAPILAIIGIVAVIALVMEWVIWTFARRISRWVSVAVTLLLIVPTIRVIYDPATVGTDMGPLILVALFAAVVASVAALASWFEDVGRIPVTLVLLGLAIGFSIWDRNDNHEIRLRVTGPPAEPRAMAALPEVARYDPQAQDRRRFTEVERHFLDWLTCRPDYEPGKPYTVYLAAAQGGGLYAAYQSARFLALAEDQVPGFSTRLFAISGVSGGAVGASVYASMIRDFPPRYEATDGRCLLEETRQDRGPGFYSKSVQAILGQDYLSPVGAAMLFPDALARFSHQPVEDASRARAIEVAFERHYARAFGREPGDDPNFGLSRPIYGHWNPGDDAPMLLLNTTDVSTGTRMIASSPLRTFPADQVATFRGLLACEGEVCAAPRLSTAMMLSARFPVVTPAGAVLLEPCASDAGDRRYCDPGGDASRPKARFVDGGYYENSGLDTIADLIETLQPIAAQRQIYFSVIAFDTQSDTLPSRSYWLGEIMSPIRALNSARSARVHPARARVETQERTLFFPVSLDARAEAFTLGWLLSRKTFARIDRDIYDQELCDPDNKGRSLAGIANAFTGLFQNNEKVTIADEKIRLDNCSVWNNIRNDLRLALRS